MFRSTKFNVDFLEGQIADLRRLVCEANKNRIDEIFEIRRNALQNIISLQMRITELSDKYCIAMHTVNILMEEHDRKFEALAKFLKVDLSENDCKPTKTCKTCKQGIKESL